MGNMLLSFALLSFLAGRKHIRWVFCVILLYFLHGLDWVSLLLERLCGYLEIMSHKYYEIEVNVYMTLLCMKDLLSCII